MKIGVGLPASVPGVKGEVILDWARRADAGPFSSLGIIDRLVYANYEPLITLAAAAAVTQRVRLMTTVLLAPLRGSGLLAKQAASLDALSGGRFTLGLGIGRREDDFKAAPARYTNRGRRFERQLATMTRIWAGEGPREGVGPIGPPPVQKGGPELLIGALTPEAVRRVGRWANGFLSGAARATGIESLYQVAEEAWKAEGRPGRPRLVGVTSYALGPRANEQVSGYIRAYYAFMSPAVVEQMVQGAITSAEGLKARLRDYSGIGMDELVLLPSVTDIGQLERLADLVS